MGREVYSVETGARSFLTAASAITLNVVCQSGAGGIAL